MITEYLRKATGRELNAAMMWTADNLHIPVETFDTVVAVAYVERHYSNGQHEGWQGFCADV